MEKRTSLAQQQKNAKIGQDLNIIDESKFLIDERVRDIIKVNDNKIVMFLENTRSLAILEKR